MAYRKLGRDSSARKALFRSILTSFFKYERKALFSFKRIPLFNHYFAYLVSETVSL